MDAILNIVNNEDEVLRKALRRCGMQAARMELHASALASKAAGEVLAIKLKKRFASAFADVPILLSCCCFADRWAVTPPPTALTPESQEVSVRKILRVFAVMSDCFAPFDAWWRLCAESRRDKLATVRSQAGSAARASRLRVNLMNDLHLRFRKLDATLQSLGRRVRLRDAVLSWAINAFERKALRRGGTMLITGWLARWRTQARLLARFGGPTYKLQRRMFLAAGLRKLYAAAAARRWLHAQHRFLELRRAWPVWRRRRAQKLTRNATAAVLLRRRRTLLLNFALRRWHGRMLRRTKADLTRHQDAALSSLLTLWGVSAHHVIRVLTACPAGGDDEATAALCTLGGGWAGGRGAVQIAVAELSRCKKRILEERVNSEGARARGEGSAERVNELFLMLNQQRANLSALTEAVARSEAEDICLQRSMHDAELRAAALRAHPLVAATAETEFGAMPDWVEQIERDVMPADAAAASASSPERFPLAAFPLAAFPQAASPSLSSLSHSPPAPAPPAMPARPLVALYVAESEAEMRSRIVEAEQRFTQTEARLIAVEQRLQRAIAQAKARGGSAAAAGGITVRGRSGGASASGASASGIGGITLPGEARQRALRGPADRMYTDYSAVTPHGSLRM